MKSFYTLIALFLLVSLEVHISLAETSNQWIVITSINAPTQAIKKLASIPGWNVIVVADKKTPLDWSIEGCTLLTLEDQKKLDSQIYKFLPFNHYVRKNLGYLYAISQGAEVIYDTDDDNIPLNQTLRYFPAAHANAVIGSNKPYCNIYHYFGCPTVWPRGFPLEEILCQQNSKFKFKQTNPLIQQALVNGNPDVDAIFRLTRKLNIEFSTQPDIISLSQKTMCPFNTQSTFFHKEAFWGLLIPASTKFRVCDIWRGYITQRLLWDIDGNLSFLSPQVVQERNEHNLAADFADEIDLYTKSKSLIDHLTQWTSTSIKLEDRIIELVQDLVDHKFYEPIEIELVKAWIHDLKALNYQFPLIHK